MKIDPARYVGAVTREVRQREHEGRPARVVVARRTYDSTMEDVWDALTNPERIPRWFLPVSGELRLGGHYQFEGNAGGDITECEPPRRLAVTWGAGGGPASWVTVVLTDDPGGGTCLELEHMAHVDDDLWYQFGPGAVGVGWDLAVMGLALHIETREAVSPEANAAWSASEEGKAFIRLSSDDWCRASIAFGTAAAAAKAAAQRTTGFYTGEDPAPAET